MIGLAAGLEATGVLQVLAKYVLGKSSKVWLGQVRTGCNSSWPGGRACNPAC